MLEQGREMNAPASTITAAPLAIVSTAAHDREWWREEAAIEAEPTFADDAWSAHTRGRAAAATVEALVYGLRDGIEKLNHDRLRRLSELNEEQLRAVCERLQNFKPHIAPAWSPEEVEALAVIWSDLRHEAQSEHE
jgi:hypothetical protein